VDQDVGRSARRAGRCDLQVPIQIETEGASQFGLTENICTGGLFIATGNPGRVGDQIVLKLRLPGTRELVSVDGEIRWVRSTADISLRHGARGMGVRFVNIPLDAAATVQEFLRQSSSTTTA
jgi:uncharacterized protein (TIGR02266 family)